MTLPVTDYTHFYSPFNMLGAAKPCAEDFLQGLNADLATGAAQSIEVGGVRLIYRRLAWDSDFFRFPIFRLDYAHIPQGTPFSAVQAAVTALQAKLAADGDYYLFGEVPSEDTPLIAGLGSAGWRLIETRITCIHDELKNYEAPERTAVRDAQLEDIPTLRRAAVEAVNHYDRFQADDFFTQQMADDFLAIFVENSVKGFADEVIVPAEGPADAFLTGKHFGPVPALGGLNVSKMVLSAVLPSRKGWYTRLIGELSTRFREQGVQAAFMTTQATNRAVLKVWWRHGYRVGRCSHIFSTYSRKESA